MLILMDDGCVLDTSIYRDSDYFQEEVVWNGFMHEPRCSRNAAISSRQYVYPVDNRFYLVEITFDNRVTFARRFTLEMAARWMIYNNYHDRMPDNLRQIAHSMSLPVATKILNELHGNNRFA